MADLVTPACADDSTLPAVDPSDLDSAIRVGQRMLAAYGNTSGYNIYAYAQAHGALAESLRILLRALGTEPHTAAPAPQPRCPSAHPDDPTPCSGPVVVTVLDAGNAGLDGCEHHAARLLATLHCGRPVAKPDAPCGVALDVFRAAGYIRPYPWREER